MLHGSDSLAGASCFYTFVADLRCNELTAVFHIAPLQLQTIASLPAWARADGDLTTPPLALAA